MILKNKSGLTVIELLITISVGSIVITMLMGIMANVLLTRNVVDYTNRVDQELFDMTESIRRLMGDTSYSTIYQPEGYEGEVILITRELDPTVIDEDDEVRLNRDNFQVDILFLDLANETIYYSTLFTYDEEESLADDIEDAIEDFINEMDTHIDEFIASPSGQLVSSRFIILDGTISINDDHDETCEKSLNTLRLEEQFNVENIVSECLSAYIDFDFTITYRLQSGRDMPERSFRTSILVP